MNASYRKHSQVVALKQSQIEFCESAIQTIEKELKCLVAQDTALKDKIEKLVSIPGIGFETALILACETNGFKLFQMDVKSVFLNGEINEKVYVEQPSGFEDPNIQDMCTN